MHKTTIIGLAVSLSATTALAQKSSTAPPFQSVPRNVFASASVGVQPQSRTLKGEFTFPVYNQDATVSTATGVDGGPIFDVSGGYRFMKRYGAGLGFTAFGSKGTTSGAASVPDPIFFNRFASVAVPASDAKRRERAVYLMGVAFFPLTSDIEAAVFGGPSFIHISQELIAGATVPAGTQNVNPTVGKESGNGVGGIIGVDLNYSVTDMVGVGAFLRFNGGSADLPSAKNAKAGGFQLGAGVRVRY